VVKLTQIVRRPAIVVPLAGSDRDAAVAELVASLAGAGAFDPSSREVLVSRILERERKGSTGFGKGVAVPHVKHEGVTGVAAAVGLSPRGIEFQAIDHRPVHHVFLLVSPDDQPEEHLQAMEVIFKNLSKESFRRGLVQARTPDEVWSMLEEADGHTLSG
jgi:mannitol/fructose-specific phosphotransferase system IIA component (Ntr-type)